VSPAYLARVQERIEGLIVEAQKPALVLLAGAADQGVALRITRTVDTWATQAAYFAQGRQALDQVNALRAGVGLAPITERQNRFTVTKARPGRSWHNWRRALDVVPVDEATSPDLRDPDNPLWNAPYWPALGELGEALGYEWGGRWGDNPHFQWTHGATLDGLLAQFPQGLHL
jgi:peptidoglycan L-alanyl-D-glutamate endopeptidase CwlK